ncbi:Crp/Fnr family transcriptional regulator [Thiohalobacter sp. IOR34]|uniref:Crp/Fnr family transcriptional regulator n=1 Tax=Thiohalobacter sp. IOR34 TaxID=3057176 RepID=UPI00339D758F
MNDRLLDIFQSLGAADQATLLSFAEFLHSRSGAGAATVPAPVASPEPPPVEEPRDIPRPAEESVIKAVKRLAATYPMLDKSKMLNETSGLVTQHVIMGRDAAEVIDELEAVFARCYEDYRAERGGA